MSSPRKILLGLGSVPQTSGLERPFCPCFSDPSCPPCPAPASLFSSRSLANSKTPSKEAGPQSAWPGSRAVASPTAPSITWTLSCPKQLTQGEWMARLLTCGGTDYPEAGDSPLPHSRRSSPMASRWGGAPCAPQSCCPSPYPAPSHQGLSRPGAPRGAQAGKLEAISPGGSSVLPA